MSPLKKVTPVSKYVALTLMVLLPFIGAYVGYQFAPIKVVEMLVVPPAINLSKQTLLPSLSELQAQFSEQVSNKLMIELLYTTKGDSVSYFKAFVPSSSSCCGIYKYNKDTNTFLDTGISIDLMRREKVSEDGRYIAKVDQIFLEVYDLETQSRVVKQIINGEETLIAETCTYGAYAYDLEWINNNELQYGVYKNVDLSEGCPEMELLEQRTITLE